MGSAQTLFKECIAWQANYGVDRAIIIRGNGVIRQTFSVLVIATALAVVIDATVVHAQSMMTYSYDALGRVSHSERRALRTGNQADYAYDRSSNRLSVQSSGTFRPEWLNAGETLRRGEAMISYDRRFKLVLQFNGNLVLFDEKNGQLWDTGTTGSGSDTLTMQGDGNLVLYAGSRPTWNTQTFSTGSRFAVQDDGNLVVYAPGHPVWARFGCC